MSRVEPSPPRSPDDALPPVQPPTMGFILQLFVVPAVIVLIIVLVWGMFSWLAHLGENPQDYIKKLERANVARWQVAMSLADSLRNPWNASLKKDSKFAAELAAFLDRTLDAGPQNNDDITLDVFLCKALGEFEVPEGMPVLLKAARYEKGEHPEQINLAAIEAIALLSANLAKEKRQPPSAENVVEVLKQSAASDDSRIRGASAFALGVIGGEMAQEKLRSMLGDAHPDVRYNAATGLARHGDEHAVEMLVEMLDPKNEQAIQVEAEPAARDFKRTLILVNALQATRQLANANPSADLAPLAKAVETLAKADVATDIKLQAEDVGRQLASRPAPAAAS